MKVFLNGGGDGISAEPAYRRLNEIIDHSKPCLYIPLTMDSNQYDSCYEWISSELKRIDIPHIDMVRNAKDLSNKVLSNYSFLFIGGGNTFKLLNELKSSSAFRNIKEYLDNDGIVFGGSAGTIIFGNNLDSCKLDDKNEVGLKDISGYDLLHGASILCHFTNRTKEKDEESRQYLLKLSERMKILALPEEVTLFMNDGEIEIIRDRSYYLFENGIMIQK